eukprot:TRINITY_DN50422_c0_g1_i1.p1 TRINITY_DN50422_c0_g1~~TRINITY_DN50422_c0_g1_i1.p1  ORF type:complete len:767 (+),score=242.09 TRINITY_DN50422_c0_g1_i1:109-2301(+)
MAPPMSCARRGVAIVSRRLAAARRAASSAAPRTMYQKIWDDHVVDTLPDGTCIVYIDRHLVHEVTSPQAFEGLVLAGRDVRRKDLTLTTVDHNVSTAPGRTERPMENEESRIQCEALAENVKRFGLEHWGLKDLRQGIVHIIGPEQGFTLPGTTLVCGDSHTATHGAFGALAFGIGTSEVEHVLATQTLLMKQSKSMRINVTGSLPLGVTSKDLILHIIGVIGTAGGTGHVIEYSGPAVMGLSMEGRMTMCNMTIEAGARAGLVAPDDTCINYLMGRPLAPSRDLWPKAEAYWRSLVSDPGAKYDTEHEVTADTIIPQVTWGTSPEAVVPVTGAVPRPEDAPSEEAAAQVRRQLEYMGLQGGTPMQEIAVDKVFIGSCTNSRIEDIRAAAEVASGRKVASSIKRAMVVPGSGLVKQQAEKEGLDKILTEAGFEWREPGCSMCLGMNEDKLDPYERSASTSNRNFEGRQGARSRTHLVSPAMAAAAAVTGRLTDVRQLSSQRRAAHTSARPRRAVRRASGSASAGMQPFTVLKGIAAPLERANVDTDLIIPKQFLKTIKRTGLGVHLFEPIRFKPDGSENPDFVLNQGIYRNAKILVAGANFGCGSSREHAPWALGDFGIRCVISTSFADIFASNCTKNGMLPVAVSESDLANLMADAKAGKELEVDLPNQCVRRPCGSQVSFDIDPFKKDCLVNGLDEIGVTLAKEDRIRAYEEKQREQWPWLSLRYASA